MKLSDFEVSGFRITWKLIHIGFKGSEIFKDVLSTAEIINFAIKQANSNQNPIIAELAYEYSANVDAINECLRKLVNMENSDYDIEFRKWRVLYVMNNLPSRNEDYVRGLIKMGDIWSKFDFPKDSPHIFQGRGNRVSPQQYYTERNYNILRQRHVVWMVAEMNFLKNRDTFYE